MDFFSNSVGSALDWAYNYRQDSNARRNAAANRKHLIASLQTQCQKSGFQVDVIRQVAIAPAIKVAIKLGHKEQSAMLEYGGDNWSDIVFGIVKQLQDCDEATVLVQLEAREARAFVCCTQPRDGIERKRQVTISDVVDTTSLAGAYQAASAARS